MFVLCVLVVYPLVCLFFLCFLGVCVIPPFLHLLGQTLTMPHANVSRGTLYSLLPCMSASSKSHSTKIPDPGNYSSSYSAVIFFIFRKLGIDTFITMALKLVVKNINQSEK